MQGAYLSIKLGYEGVIVTVGDSSLFFTYEEAQFLGIALLATSEGMIEDYPSVFGIDFE